MKIKNMPIEELELMSYTDLTYALLKEEKKPLSTPVIFKKICDLLGLTESDYASKIGDYYTSLTIDKRFVLLDSNEWDVCDNHSIKIVLDDEEDEGEDLELDLETEYDEIEDEENIEDAIDDESLDDDEEDLEELEIIDEDEIEEEDL